MALRDTADRVGSLVLVDAVGIEVPGHPVADFFSLTMAEVFALSFHDPKVFAVDPATLPPEQQQMMAVNREALSVYAGDSMTDPGLAARLAGVTIPTLVAWGESDHIADAQYGPTYASAIPGAQFELLTETGHMPQMETPKELVASVLKFADETQSGRRSRSLYQVTDEAARGRPMRR